MKLIADSGSTKTDWKLITPSGEVFDYRSEGINPYFHTDESVAETLRKISFAPYAHADIDEVYFYSAGSNTKKSIAIMNNGFNRVFTSADIHIKHDLLGAARALCQNSSGMVAILGTGSNSCLYVDGEIKMNLGGFGYILGDEGSGMHIGRKIVREYMNDLMPNDMQEIFSKKYQVTKDQIIYAVYKDAYPNRFLASFSRFASENIDHPYISEMVDDAFMKFFERYIIHYPGYKKYNLRVLGSIGFFFEKQLRARAERYDVNIDKIMQAPIDGLLEYHQEN
ncbi:MAG: N-acetylglucosamine kinase [Bacteroidota bacterium]